MFNYISFVNMIVLLAYMCQVLKDVRTRALGPLKFELLKGLSCHIGTGN